LRRKGREPNSLKVNIGVMSHKVKEKYLQKEALNFTQGHMVRYVVSVMEQQINIYKTTFLQVQEKNRTKPNVIA